MRGLDRLVLVPCLVCGQRAQQVLFSAQEVRAHLTYLRLFHRRRLRPGPDVEEALKDRADFTQDYITDIVCCAACGLVFRNPRPTDAAITRAYSRDHYGASKLTEDFDAQLPFYRDKADALARHLPVHCRPRVVEVGSWVGDFLTAGRERGWDMLGVDPGAEVVAFCRARDLPVKQSTLQQASIPAGSVDCVAIWNTFDQLPDPRPTLTAAVRALRSGGVLVVRVPNGACVRLLGRWHHHLPAALANWLHAAMAWNNLLAFPYLYGYSVDTLDWLMDAHGLTRYAVEPDLLPRTANGLDRRWAVWEEAALKLALRATAKLPPWLLAGAPLSPWIDVYYRRD